MGLKPNEMVAAVIIVAFVLVIVAVGLYPTLHQATSKQCLANLKEVNTAISLYAGDNGVTFPRAENWADVLAPQYLEDINRLVCPSAQPTPEQLAGLKNGEGPGVPIGYAVFRPLVCLPTSRFADPAKTPVVFDSTDIRRDAVADITTLDLRHVGKVGNISFSDGHIESVSQAPAVPKPLFKPAEPPAKRATPPGP